MFRHLPISPQSSSSATSDVYKRQPFSAELETELDEIAEHKADKTKILEKFYVPFSKLMEKADKEIEAVEAPVEVSDVKCEKCGRMMVIKQGRFGKFLACPGFPECRNTKPILHKIGVKCPECGGEVIERKTKTRRIFYGCANSVSYTHLRAHETRHDIVCRLLLEKKKKLTK